LGEACTILCPRQRSSKKPIGTHASKKGREKIQALFYEPIKKERYDERICVVRNYSSAAGHFPEYGIQNFRLVCRVFQK